MSYRDRGGGYGDRGSGGDYDRGFHRERPERRISVMVRNLPKSITSDDLRYYAEKYGGVKDVYLPKDYYTGEPRGLGFVEFFDERDAADAVRGLDRMVLGGREIQANYAMQGRKRPDDYRGSGEGEAEAGAATTGVAVMAVDMVVVDMVATGAMVEVMTGTGTMTEAGTGATSVSVTGMIMTGDAAGVVAGAAAEVVTGVPAGAAAGVPAPGAGVLPGHAAPAGALFAAGAQCTAQVHHHAEMPVVPLLDLLRTEVLDDSACIQLRS